jgi:hypothetical protein
MKVREHRGEIGESILTMVELPDNSHATLYAHVAKILGAYDFHFQPEALRVLKYHFTHDRATGWEQTWIVTIQGYGVFGFCDGPLRAEA